jgi:hypothetical protein
MAAGLFTWIIGPGAVVASVLLSGGMSMVSEAQTQGRVIVACGRDDPGPDCAQVIQALRRARPDRDIRRGTARLTRPEQPGDIALQLRVDQVGPRRLTAHLEWHDAQESAPRTGPPLELSVMDAPLSDSMYPRFLDDLIRISGLPF